MKKKIIAAVMAITLLFVISVISVGAYYQDVDGYDSNIFIYDRGTYIEMRGIANHNPGSDVSIRMQCVVLYTDDTYSYGYKNCLTNPDALYVNIDTSKTISYIDAELHIYDNGVYIGTASHSFYYPYND